MNSTKCFLYGAKGKSKDRFAQNLKVANRSFSVVETLSGGSSKRIHARAAGGMIMPPKGSTQRGLPSGRFFGDFLIGEKVTRGAGRSARIGGCRGCRPAKVSPGCRAERLHIGSAGAARRGPRPPHQKNLLPFAAKYSIINGHDNKNAREGGRAVPQGRTCF